VAAVLSASLAIALIVSSAHVNDQRPEGAGGVSASLAAQLPTYFVENQGQVGNRADFYVESSTGTTYFDDQGLYFVSAAKQGEDEGTWTTFVRFVEQNQDVHPIEVEASSAFFSYFRGAEEDWKTGVPAAKAIVYRNLWDGIDMRVEGANGSLKYTFTVAPGADPSAIAMEYVGAEIQLENGALVAETPGARYVDNAPTAFQPDGSSQRDVPAQFVLNGSTATFALGEYDPALPLVIDPIVVTYASYLGGAALDDVGGGVRIDADGNLYIGGRTMSADAFTGEPGFDGTYGGGALFDGYVAKYSPNGEDLLWGTYIGGTQDDTVFGMALDAAGDVYVTGTTKSSTGQGFPIGLLPGYDSTYNGTTEQDAFLCKIDTGGLILRYCSYLGGPDGDFGFEVAVDSSERAYVVGMTSSSQGEGFPVTLGAFDTTHNGSTDLDSDAFITRFEASGGALSYSSYIGGDDGLAAEEFREEQIFNVTVDDSFNAYVTGNTTSDEATFPDGDGFDAVPGYNQAHAGGRDAFIATVDPTGATLLGATWSRRGRSLRKRPHCWWRPGYDR
jgi:hypothetical protein